MIQNESIRQNNLPEENKFDLRDWLIKLLKSWSLLVGLLALSLTISWLYLRYKIPLYNISASVLIKDEMKGLSENAVFDALNLFGEKKIVENEINILQSKSLARQVVKNLHLYATTMVEGRVSDQSAYIHSPINIEVRWPDSIQTVSNVNFEYDSINNNVIIENNHYSLNEWVNTSHGTIKFVNNSNYNGRQNERSYYFILQPIKRATNQILSRISVQESGKNSTVIRLNYRDEVPKRGEDILNELIKVYNNAAIQDKNALAANTLQFVDERLKYVVAELDSVEGALQRYKTKNGITNISTEGEIFLETVSTNDLKISDISMQLAILEEVEKYVTGKQESGNILPTTLGINNPLLANLLEKLNQVEVSYSRLVKLVPENHPSAIILRDEMDNLRPNILESIRTQRKSLIAGQNDLAVTNNRFLEILRSIPQKERALLDISRQQVIKNNIYTFLLQKREEAAISYASTVADSRIIDSAETSEYPVSPKPNLIYLSAVFIAFSLTGGYVSLRQLFNNKIQSRDEIEKLTNASILGEVNLDKSGKQLVMLEDRNSYIAEQFRHIRVSLSFLGINESHKKIMVTSSISGEGKSFITANLGVSIAMAGKKVILIELDLRRPKLADAFSVSRNSGISNYLIGKKTINEIILSTNINNLYLITSGPLPPNPAELLLNEKLDQLFTSLCEKFDLILIDLPPVGPVSDAFVLSNKVDLTLFILREGYTPKWHIKMIDKFIENKSLNRVSVIFNGIRSDIFKKYSYNYTYEYKSSNKI